MIREFRHRGLFCFDRYDGGNGWWLFPGCVNGGAQNNEAVHLQALNKIVDYKFEAWRMV